MVPLTIHKHTDTNTHTAVTFSHVNESIKCQKELLHSCTVYGGAGSLLWKQHRKQWLFVNKFPFSLSGHVYRAGCTAPYKRIISSVALCWRVCMYVLCVCVQGASDKEVDKSIFQVQQRLNQAPFGRLVRSSEGACSEAFRLPLSGGRL